MWFFLTIIAALGTIVSFLAAIEFSDFYGIRSFLPSILFGAATYFLFTSHALQTEAQEHQSRYEQVRAERSKPYLISKMDNGCEVYEFFGYRDGDVHHFVRCPNASTESTDAIHIGKTKRSDDVSTQ